MSYHEDKLDAFLDAHASNPLAGSLPQDATDDPDLAGAAEGAMHFHSIANRVERNATIAPEQHRIWQEVLDQSEPRTSWMNRFTGRFPQLNLAWSTAITALLIVGLLATIGYSFWTMRLDNDPAAPPQSLWNYATDQSTIVKEVDALTPDDCPTTPMSREVLLRILRQASGNPPRSLELVEFAYSQGELEGFVQAAEHYYACVALGLPVSAFSFATEDFIRDTITNDVLATYGTVNSEVIELHVDSLYTRETQVRDNPAFETITIQFQPQLKAISWTQTEDGRVHMQLAWLNDEGNVNSQDQVRMVTMYLDSLGGWCIDRVTTDRPWGQAG